MCSLDAEKYFDSIRYSGIVHKFQTQLAETLWRFLLNGCNNLTAVIKWNGHTHYDMVFLVNKGTRQGSIPSPVLV